MNRTSTGRLIPVAALLFGMVGCGAGTADLDGKVTYLGKSVVSGNVAVVYVDGRVESTEIGTDGTYHLAGISAGTVKIAVASPDPSGSGGSDKEGRANVGPGALKGPAAGPPKSWFPLPAKYSQPDQSGLGLTMKAGKNQLDIPME